MPTCVVVWVFVIKLVSWSCAGVRAGYSAPFIEGELQNLERSIHETNEINMRGTLDQLRPWWNLAAKCLTRTRLSKLLQPFVKLARKLE